MVDRRAARLAGVTLAVVTVCMALTGPAQADVRSAAVPASVVCGRGLESPPCTARPAALEFSDNHDLVASGLAWSGWGKATAAGKGDITVNWTGTPSTHRGTVTLSDLRPCQGRTAYRRGRVSWPGQSVTIRFDCRRDAQPRYLQFHSTDGSLGCGLLWDPVEGPSARCDVAGARYATPSTPDCQDLDQGDSLSLSETVTSTCHGDTVLRGGRVLAAGHSRRVGDIRCTMGQSAVTCRNVATGHGFRMSRSAYRTW